MVTALLGAPDALVFKVPTADLESLQLLKPDEAAFGLSDHALDDFLEGKEVAGKDADLILCQYRAPAHQRSLPASP